MPVLIVSLPPKFPHCCLIPIAVVLPDSHQCLHLSDSLSPIPIPIHIPIRIAARSWARPHHCLPTFPVLLSISFSPLPILDSPYPSPVPVVIALTLIRFLSSLLSHSQPHPNPILADITVLILSVSQSHPCPCAISVPFSIPFQSLSCPSLTSTPIQIPSLSSPYALRGNHQAGSRQSQCCCPWVLTRCPHSAGSS